MVNRWCERRVEKSMSTLLEDKKHNKLWAAHSDTDSKQAITLQSFHIFNPLKYMQIQSKPFF